MRIPVAGLLAILVARAAAGLPPSPEQFESAAIRPFAPNANGSFPIGIKGGPGTGDPDRVTYTNYSLKFLVMLAYNVKDFQVSSPDWMNENSARFLIEAKLHAGATQEQLNRMLQNLLTDRFRLTLHRESRDLPHYEITVANSGPKLTEHVDDPKSPPHMTSVIIATTATHRIAAKGQTIEQLADLLSRPSFGPVLDQTGLTKKFDFTLDYAVSDVDFQRLLAQNIQNLPAAPASPDLPQAIQQQLGLKLESKKGPIDVLVVDHCEKQPAETKVEN